MFRAENGARTLEDLLKSEEKEYGRKIAKAQKVGLSCSALHSWTQQLVGAD